MQANYEVKARIALKAWLEANKISVAKLARMLDANNAGVWKWYNGLFTPSLMVAIRLEIITEGAVPCHSWMPTLIQTSEKKAKQKNAAPTKNSKKTDADKHSKGSAKGRN